VPYFPSNTFDRIVILDPPGSAYDDTILSLDLRMFDLTTSYGRTGSHEVNMLNFAEFLRNRPDLAEEQILAVMSADRFLPDLSRILRDMPHNVSLYAVSRRRIDVVHERFVTHGVPAGITADEFTAKIRGHLAKLVGEQPEGGNFNPASQPFPTAEVSLSSLAELAAVEEPWGVLTTDLGGLPLNAVYRLKPESRALVVMNQSALGGRENGLPKFQRWKWVEDIHASTLVLNDPTLYVADDILCGWFVGTEDVDLVPLFTDAVTVLAAQLGVPDNRIIFYGGSAGAFTSLSMAAELPCSLAVVDIPQTDLFTYHIPSVIDRLAQECFQSDNRENVAADLRYRFNVVERFRRLGRCPEFIYYQNTWDVTHVNSQYLSFRDAVDADFPNHKGRFETYEFRHPLKGGHVPMSRRDTVAVINDALESRA
jgi:hypothetical protein